MITKLFKVLSLVAIALSVATTLFGQDVKVVSAAGDKFVISAKAGGVNYTEGRVVIARREGKSGQLLKGDEVEIGDTVATGTDGRAEILLNPGSYMRIDKETEFSFISTSLDDLKLKLNSGSAIFEVIADEDFRVSVQSPKSLIELTRSGVYRIDVLADGGVRVSVTKGAALVGSEQVKAGRAATLGGETVAVAKFDKDQKDALDIWSKDRAKELTKVNAGVQRKALRDSLVNSFSQNRWNMYDSFGLWVFDPFRSFWCFMPFGYGWGSPYGFGYGWDFWRIGMPQWIYYAPPPVRSWPTAPPNGPVAGRTAPTSGQPTGAPRRRIDNPDGSGRPVTPPYRRMEASDRGGEGVVPRRVDFPRSVDPGSPMPSNTGGSIGPSAPVRAPSAPVRESTPRADPPVRGRPRDN